MVLNRHLQENLQSLYSCLKQKLTDGVVTEVVLVGIEDNHENVAVVVLNANVVDEYEDKVDMDRTTQEEDQLQKYVVELVHRIQTILLFVWMRKV